MILHPINPASRRIDHVPQKGSRIRLLELTLARFKKPRANFGVITEGWQKGRFLGLLKGFLYEGALLNFTPKTKRLSINTPKKGVSGLLSFTTPFSVF